MEQTIKSAFESYLMTADLRPASIRFKRRALNYFVQWFGDITPDTATLAMAEDYKTMLAKGRSKRAANGYLANFKPFWGWLLRHGRIDENPFEVIKRYRVTDEPRETFKLDELSRMISCSDRLWRIRICLGLLGCRRGEALNLIDKDIHLADDNPHILLAPKKRTKRTWPWDLKDHAVRYVPLPEIIQFNGTQVRLHEDIRERINLIKGINPYLCIEYKHYAKLIDLLNEGKLTDEHVSDPIGNFQRRFRSLQKRAVVNPPKRFHELRACFITRVADECGLSKAAEAAGHSSVEITRRYVRFERSELLADLNAMFNGCYKN